MLGSSYPGRTLAEVAGQQLWFGCLLNPSPALPQILLGGFVANGGDLDCWRNIAITLIDLIVTIRLGIPTGVMSLIASIHGATARSEVVSTSVESIGRLGPSVC